MGKKHLLFYRLLMVVVGMIVCLRGAALAEVDPAEIERVMGQLDWRQGPGQHDLGLLARIMVPAGSFFLNGDDTRTLMTAAEELTDGSEVGLVVSERWWQAYYSFADVGYVRDDEKDSLDADAMLKNIRKGIQEGNKERRKRGWPEMELIGWALKPQYNEQTHNLEWALRLSSNNEEVINHNTRILGRRGMMVVTLVANPEDYGEALPWFRSLQEGFSYVQGQRYAEFRDGDKVAKMGLTALVVGGATAVAVKSGFFKWIWKGLVFVGIGIAGFFRKLFGGRGRGGDGGSGGGGGGDAGGGGDDQIVGG